MKKIELLSKRLFYLLIAQGPMDSSSSDIKLSKHSNYLVSGDLFFNIKSHLYILILVQKSFFQMKLSQMHFAQCSFPKMYFSQIQRRPGFLRLLGRLGLDDKPCRVRPR